MKMLATEDRETGVTLYRQPKPKVTFDDEAQPVDQSTGPESVPQVVDWEIFEEMVTQGKFVTKGEAKAWCEHVYTLIYDPDDESTHWSESAWQRIRRGMFPEARAALAALPQQVPSTRRRAASTRIPGNKLLAAGKCNNGHKIKTKDDLALSGLDAKGEERLTCIHCRRARSQRARAKKKG